MQERPHVRSSAAAAVEVAVLGQRETGAIVAEDAQAATVLSAAEALLAADLASQRIEDRVDQDLERDHPALATVNGRSAEDERLGSSLLDENPAGDPPIARPRAVDLDEQPVNPAQAPHSVLAFLCAQGLAPALRKARLGSRQRGRSHLLLADRDAATVSNLRRLRWGRKILIPSDRAPSNQGVFPAHSALPFAIQSRTALAPSAETSLSERPSPINRMREAFRTAPSRASIASGALIRN